MRLPIQPLSPTNHHFCLKASQENWSVPVCIVSNNGWDDVCIHIICRPILKSNYIATAFSRLLMKTCHKNGLLPQKKWILRPRLCTYVWPYSKPLPQSVSKVLYVCVRRTDLNGWTLKTNNTIKAFSFDLGLVFRILYENFPMCDALEWAIFP